MAVRRGAVTPTKIYRGTTPVQKVMRGTVEVWSASPYPASGTWGPFAFTARQYPYPVILTHTIEESGSFTFTLSSTPSLESIFYNRNGSYVTSGNTWTANLSEGDTIVVDVDVSEDGTHNGTWSIVKN